MRQDRVEKVLEQMALKQLNQMLISDPVAICYLTGKMVDPGERFYALYLNAKGGHVIFINELFTVPEELGVEKLWYNDASQVLLLVAERMDKSCSLGVDKNLPARFLLPLQNMGIPDMVLASDCIDNVRACKDEQEQKWMKEVSRINDLAMEQFKKLIVPGITEQGMAEQMRSIYCKLGADGYSFEPLVAFGANAAEGHHMPDDTILKEGDCVLVDVGCKKDGYCADMTRTFFYKRVSEAHRKVYEIVRKANETAIAGIKPGVPLKEIDALARDIIAQAGYGPKFTHRLGHFIGLEVHEAGDVSAVNEEPARLGMIFSIEPGIYLEGEMGVRIEDLVLVTQDGCQRLNYYNKELEIVE